MVRAAECCFVIGVLSSSNVCSNNSGPWFLSVEGQKCLHHPWSGSGCWGIDWCCWTQGKATQQHKSKNSGSKFEPLFNTTFVINGLSLLSLYYQPVTHVGIKLPNNSNKFLSEAIQVWLKFWIRVHGWHTRRLEWIRLKLCADFVNVLCIFS